MENEKSADGTRIILGEYRTLALVLFWFDEPKKRTFYVNKVVTKLRLSVLQKEKVQERLANRRC
jgi:hypothetical protein